VSMIAIVAVGLTGGLGAALRFLADGTIRHHTSGTYPVGTMVINFTGSLLLGVLTGLVVQQAVPHSWQAVIGTGLLGGYTTFSTASFETVRLLEDRRYWSALINGLGMLILCTGAAAGGYLAGLHL
jgi:CrcB protein